MSDPVRNWFTTPWVAPRYAVGRPDVHRGVAARVRERVAPGDALERGLDVGCGTGLSTRAMRAAAHNVVGVDLSRPMLGEAQRAGGGPYARGCAEALPFADASFDLVTMGCAWHWCQPGPFLDGVARVLRPGGWLVVYDSFFRADDGALYEWLLQSYWQTLQRVGRRDNFEGVRLRHPSLAAEGRIDVVETAAMTRDQVRTLITSQASTVGNVEWGTFTIEEAERRIDEGLAPFFPDSEALPMRFMAPVDFVRRVA